MQIKVNNWLNIIQKKLLPPRCLFCGQPGFDDMDLCQACYAELPMNHDCCPRCGEHFELASASPSLCGRCLKKPPGFDLTQAPFLYEQSLKFLITQLKFQQRYPSARLLGTLLAKHLSKTAEMPECLIPIPLHRQRYRDRGFNQSIEIARHLSRQLSIPMDVQSCIRHRDTAHQTDLPAKLRRKNMQRAFSIIRPVQYRHVAIVDDVMTTGATASSLAETLKHHGVSRVDAWVCARA